MLADQREPPSSAGADVPLAGNLPERRPPLMVLPSMKWYSRTPLTNSRYSGYSRYSQTSTNNSTLDEVVLNT